MESGRTVAGSQSKDRLKVQGTRYTVQGTRYRVSGSKPKSRNPEILFLSRAALGAGEIAEGKTGTRFKVRGSRCKAQGERFKE